jgi:membrane associated rhomboid family serine protease
MFLAIPVGMNYRTERLPLVTLTLIGINTLVYIVSLVCFFATQGDSDDWILHHLWLIPAVSYPWMYLTSMFVHGGIFHLAGNMIFLFLFGSCVEDMIGRVNYTIFYLLGGLVAELVYIAMLPGHFASDMPMGGASGAIAACMGMYLLLRAGENIEFKYFFWFFLIYMRAGEFEVPAWLVIGFFFLTNLASAILDMMSPSPHAGGVAFGAHIGGMIAGVVMMLIYKRARRSPEEVEAESSQIINPAELIARTTRAPVTSETPTIYLHDGTTQSGPFTLTHVQAMLSHGQIGLETQYWSEGMAEWQGVRDLAASPLG